MTASPRGYVQAVRDHKFVEPLADLGKVEPGRIVALHDRSSTSYQIR